MRIWDQALELARATPASRNRYVDLLRAASILAVVYGHWLAAAPFRDGQGSLQFTHLLAAQPGSQYLTWVIQVMPVFFFVGGYSNGISWRGAKRRGQDFSAWLDGRLRRLIGPTLPVVLVWAVLGFVAPRFGVDAEWAGRGSQAALIPLWFLAVYLVIALLVPLTHALWERLGLGSLLLLGLPAFALDAQFFLREEGTPTPLLSWLNYLAVWCTVHQLGYAWLDGRLAGARRLLMFLVGFGGVVVATKYGPYPLSMVGVPGDLVSNTTPPKAVILLLGIGQVGGLLLLEDRARRWLASDRAWAATVLINGMIMTVFLWHMTVLVLGIGLSQATGGWGLGAEPASGPWWAWKALWMVAWTCALALAVGPLMRFERPRPGIAAPAWRQVVAALSFSTGLGLMAYGGVVGEGPLGVRLEVVGPILVGVLLGLPRGRAPKSKTA